MSNKQVVVVDEREIEFRSKLNVAIDYAVEFRMANKSEGEYFTFADAKDVTTKIRGFFIKTLNLVPPEIEGVCTLCEALLAPNRIMRIELLKNAVKVLGPVAGVGMIIMGIGAALGWGVGTITAILVWIQGTSLLGPIAWCVTGTALAAVCVYFALTDDKTKHAYQFRSALRNGMEKSLHLIWEKYGDRLYDQIAVIEGK